MLEKADEQQPSKEEAAHVSRLLSRIKSFCKTREDRVKGWEKARKYANGNPNDDGEGGQVRVNLIGSMLETVQPALYAKAPEIAVVPDAQTDSQNYEIIKGFSETLQAALDRFLVKDAKLKVRGKSAVRGTLTSTRAWAKVVYQVNKQEDPLIRNRINDTQDNVDQINLLLEETREGGGDCQEYEAKLVDLKDQIKALEAKIEVVVSEGLVVDILSNEDVIVLDDSCRDVDEFLQAGDIAHVIKMSVGAYKAQFKKDPPANAKKYFAGKSENQEAVDADDYLVYIYEVWSLKNNTVYTVAEGCKGYCRPPFQPKTLGEQWYPFFPLQLRRVEGVKDPLSLVEQLIELQDEYNTRRTTATEHRKKNIPVRVINKGAGITDEEITAINNRSIKTDVIGLSLDPSQPVANQIGSLPEIPYNPQMYDTSDIMRDMEMVGNTQDAVRGSINKAKTATEAEIMAMGMQSRTTEALDVVEDWITDIAIYSAQLLLQEMPAEVIKAQFGQDAVWPTLSKQQLFKQIKISIRAGSTSRPNKMRERDQWIQLLPLIQDAMTKIVEFKAQGMNDLVDATIDLLDETLKRFDEKLDAKELLGIEEGGEEESGEMEPGENEAPQIPPEVAAQVQQMQEQLQKISEQAQQLAQENAQLKAGNDIKHRELDVKEREVGLKERDVMAREDVANAEVTEKQVTVETLVGVVEQVHNLVATVSTMLAGISEMQARQSAPKTKSAVIRKLEDGSFVAESVEAVNGG